MHIPMESIRGNEKRFIVVDSFLCSLVEKLKNVHHMMHILGWGLPKNNNVINKYHVSNLGEESRRMFWRMNLKYMKIRLMLKINFFFGNKHGK